MTPCAPTPFEQIHEGDRSSHPYVLSQEVYDLFLQAFADRNALHVNDAYAQSCGFPRRVAHGSLLNGFISHFIGMHYPAGECILHSVNLQFRRPNFVGDDLVLEATVKQVIEAVRAVVLEVRVVNQTQDQVTANARVQVGFL